MLVFSMISPGTTGTETPPGITALSLRSAAHCRRTAPAGPRTACPAAARSCAGSLTCPDTEKISVPPEFAGPSAANHCRPLAQDGRHRGEAQRVVDGGGRAVQAEVGRERRLEARLAGLALERLEQRRLLAADVGAGADEGVQVEVDAGAADVLAEQAGRVGFGERRLEARHRFAEELAADVVVGDRRSWWRSRRSPCPRSASAGCSAGCRGRGRCRARSRRSCTPGTSASASCAA